jgi:hypothetical protein
MRGENDTEVAYSRGQGLGVLGFQQVSSISMGL